MTAPSLTKYDFKIFRKHCQLLISKKTLINKKTFVDLSGWKKRTRKENQGARRSRRPDHHLHGTDRKI